MGQQSFCIDTRKCGGWKGSDAAGALASQNLQRRSSCGEPRRPLTHSPVSLDPNTHTFVLATAFFTSIFFAIAAFIPAAFLLRFLLFG